MEKKSAVCILFAVALIFTMVGCATLETAGHKYMMRGQVLDVSDGMAYLCIGSQDGAQAGQELEAYRFTRLPSAASKQGPPAFKRERVGAVKITEVVDVHYARAKILTGEVRENDVVELK